jgi:hypothetical protein
MTTKEQIIQELEQLPEAQLEAVLTIVRSFKEQSHQAEDPIDPVWQAYLASKQERAEVYRRLANS